MISKKQFYGDDPLEECKCGYNQIKVDFFKGGQYMEVRCVGCSALVFEDDLGNITQDRWMKLVTRIGRARIYG